MSISRWALVIALSTITLSSRRLAGQQTPPPAPPPVATDTTKTVPPKRKEPDRWAAAVDLGFNAATGNTRLMLLTTGFRLRHRETDQFKLEWGVSLRYGESRGVVIARSVRTNLVFDLNPKSMWSPYAFATVERDPFRRLALRSNTGSGVTRTFYRETTGEMSVSGAALYSHEGFTIDTQPDRDDARWSIETRGFQKIGGSVRVENAVSFKPVWDHSGDYNIQSLTKLSSKITQRLAMTLSHEYLKDSTPPSGVKREDQRVQAGLTFEF
ncbi:MAG: DUF481 domain-containing protein [Longimicrobiales bacterium]